MRAAELGVDIVRQGVEDKLAVVQRIVSEFKLVPAQVCYLGDDLPDLAVLRYAGLGVAVADACEELAHRRALCDSAARRSRRLARNDRDDFESPRPLGRIDPAISGRHVMPAGLLRTVASFAVVSASFAAYHFAVVPFIEPGIVLHESDGGVGPQPVVTTESRMSPYERFFKPGSWPLNDPIVLENSRSKLLFKQYQNLEGGRVLLTPCAMLFFPDGDLDAAGTVRRIIVLEAPRARSCNSTNPSTCSAERSASCSAAT